MALDHLTTSIFDLGNEVGIIHDPAIGKGSIGLGHLHRIGCHTSTQGNSKRFVHLIHVETEFFSVLKDRIEAQFISGRYCWKVEGFCQGLVHRYRWARLNSCIVIDFITSVLGGTIIQFLIGRPTFCNSWAIDH